MITYQTEPKTQPVAPAIETDPVEILTRAMRELNAHHGAVTRDMLLQMTDLTAGEIDANWEAARDRAKLSRRLLPV